MTVPRDEFLSEGDLDLQNLTQEELIEMFGERIPKPLLHEHEELARRINTAITPPDLVGRDSG